MALSIFGAIVRIHGAGEPVFGIVGELHGVIEIPGFGHGQHRSENLFLKNASLRIDIGNHGWLDEVTVARRGATACDQRGPLSCRFRCIRGLIFAALFVDHRAHVIRRDRRWPHFQFGDLRRQILQECIVDLRVDDGSRTGRTFLPLVSERRLASTPSTACVEIGFAIDDDGVLAAHLRDHAFDPDLTLARFRGQFVDAQADVARAGEGDEARFRMLHQHVADQRAAACEQ